jgi:hypothetical protein
MRRPHQLQIGVGLFRNLTRVFGDSNVGDPSAVGTQALLPHYAPFGLPDA